MIDFSGIKRRCGKIASGGSSKGGIDVSQSFYEELIKEGETLMLSAYLHSEYINRTKNLMDSYGSCLYVGGKEYPNSRRYLNDTPEAEVPKKWYGVEMRGREALDEFFNDFKAEKGKIQLVVVAAMPYAAIVELKYKYRVISSISSDMDSLAKKYKGRVVDLPSR